MLVSVTDDDVAELLISADIIHSRIVIAELPSGELVIKTGLTFSYPKDKLLSGGYKCLANFDTVQE